MTYNAYETSTENGTPIELYEFVQGVNRWGFISGVDSLLYSGVNYVPLAVQRDRIKQNSDVLKNSLRLTFPRENLFANQFLGFAPEDIVTVTVRRGHFGDPDNQMIVYWRGRVVGARASENTIDLECESIFTSLRRPGLRARFEYGCRHVLYSTGCLVNREAFKVESTITGLTNGIVLQVPAAAGFPDGYFSGGLILSPGGIPRFITNHVGFSLTVSRPSYDLVVGSEVSFYPGCDRTKETCNTKFNNLDNFGGFPWIPGRNPFDGSSLV